MKYLLRYGVDEPYITTISLISAVLLMISNYMHSFIVGILFLLLGLFFVLRTIRKYQLVNVWLKRAHLDDVKKCLDVGTGTGYVLTRTASHVKKAYVTGIEDDAQNHLKRARKNAKREHVKNRVNVIHGDLKHLPFPDKSFDLITALTSNCDALASKNPQVYQPICDDIYRALKVNGRCVMVNTRSNIHRLASYFRKKDARVTLMPINSRYHWYFGYRVIRIEKNED